MVGPSDYDCLLPRDRLLVSYDGDPFGHHRCLVAQISQTGWVIVAPHWELYHEDLRDYEYCAQVGPRGGCTAEQREAFPRHVQLNRADLKGRMDDLLVEGEDQATELRAEGFVPNTRCIVPRGRLKGQAKAGAAASVGAAAAT